MRALSKPVRNAVEKLQQFSKTIHPFDPAVIASNDLQRTIRRLVLSGVPINEIPHSTEVQIALERLVLGVEDQINNFEKEAKQCQ